MSTPTKKIAFHTLGCKLNFSETSSISRDFIEHGCEKVAFKDFADIYVINTCSVTENADKETKKLVRRTKRINPNSYIALVGCYAQLKPDELIALDGVNMVIGAEEKFNLLTHLDKIKIKNNEKPLNNSKTPISDQLKLKIRPQPSTNAALIISKKAAKNGFEWEKINQIWDKLYEELEELKDALKKENTAEAESEIGYVLFTLINIARWNNLSIEEGLAKTNKKFIDRLKYIEENIEGELNNQSKESLKKYWKLAKINLKH